MELQRITIEGEGNIFLSPDKANISLFWWSVSKKWYLSCFIWNSCEKLFSIKHGTAVLLWLDFGLFQYMDRSGMRIEGEVNFMFLPDRAYSTFFWYSVTKVVVFLMFILEFLWEIIQY